MPDSETIEVLAPQPGVHANGFRRDLLSGLAAQPRSIPSKHLYDKRGSELFDRICTLPEYYLTRCESQIMRRHAGEMARRLGGTVRLVELGSGSSMKTRLLLDHLGDESIYLPVDVSREHLRQSAMALAADYPRLRILPVCGDFSRPLRLPEEGQEYLPTVVYFPGSTIGNFEQHDALRLLDSIRTLCGPGGQLLIGVDLRKAPDVIHAAYNDRQGVTEAFTKNLLQRANRELDADFDLEAFDYKAEYQERAGRIKASLVSNRPQVVRVDEQEFVFEEKDEIHTEYSHKYSEDEFQRLAEQAGFVLRDLWRDTRGYFAVMRFLAID